MQVALGRLGQACRVHGLRHHARVLAQDVADALVCRSERGRFRQLREFRDRAQPAVEVGQGRDAGGTERGDRVELRGAEALVGVITAQALKHEAAKFVGQRGDVAATDLNDDGFHRLPEQRLQRQLQPALDQRARQAQRIAAQGERILVSAGLEARGEPASHGVQALGHRQHLAQSRRRDCIAGHARRVRLIDGVGDRARLAERAGVVTAHRALQFREFANHARLQVGLGQARGAHGLFRVEAQRGGHRRGQRSNALALVGVAAQLVLVAHRCQALAHRLEALLEVFLVEEPRIGEARADHPLVALAHLGWIARLDVGDADEVPRQPMRVVEHGEEFLIGLHRQHQRFVRHLQEPGLEAAQDAARPLHQAGDFLHQRVLHARGAVRVRGFRFDLAAHLCQPLVRIHQHAGAAQRIHVFAGGRDPHRLGMVEAMAAAHAIRLQSHHLARHHIVAQQHHQPVHRPDETGLARAPAHRLRDR